MDEKTVADLWDAIKEVRADIAALQDRLDYHDERHEERNSPSRGEYDRTTNRLESTLTELDDRLYRLERSL